MLQTTKYDCPISQNLNAGEKSWCGQPSHIVYAGISELAVNSSGSEVIVAIRNATQLVDYFTYRFASHGPYIPRYATGEFISHLRQYSEKYKEKIIAVALPETLAKKCLSLCSGFWKDLDTVPLVLEYKDHTRQQDEVGELATFTGWEKKELDEQADSMARKCLRSFGVGHVLHNHIYPDGMVEVDRSFCVCLVDVGDYEKTVSSETWGMARGLANDLRERKVRIAIFSMTCQEKPDVHTRHAFVRFCHTLGVDSRWYVSKPRPSILHIMRKMEDIMEGLTGPEEYLQTDDELRLLEFAYENARRYWLGQNGPLRPRWEGGADIIIIDSAPLLTLALLSKQHDPQRPVIFENRFQVQRRLLEDYTSPQFRIWEFIQNRLKQVDVLISQLPRELAPSIMPEKNVGYIPVSIDQLDGLNKEIAPSDVAFYGREFNSLCRILGTPTISYPDEQYILHLSQLRLGDGTIALLDSYAILCNRCTEADSRALLPKLLICHHGPSRSPESSLIYDRLLSYINVNLDNFASLVSVVQVAPQDQMWNSLLANARVLVQLSTLHGIPEVLLWGIQKGKPVITMREACSFSFIPKAQNVFLVDNMDTETVSEHLFHLCTNDEFYGRVCVHAPQKLPDDLTTVGNATSWMFLASKLSRVGKFEPNGEDMDKLARQEIVSFL